MVLIMSNMILTKWMKDPPRSIEVDPYKVCLDQLFGKPYKPEFGARRRLFGGIRIDSGPNSDMVIPFDSELGKQIIGTCAFELIGFPRRLKRKNNKKRRKKKPRKPSKFINLI